MFVRKNFFEKMICFKKFCKVMILFSAGMMVFGTYEISADQLKSEHEVLKRKIAERSKQNLVAQKLRQEMEAYRERYSSKISEFAEADNVLPNFKDSKEKVSDELNKFPVKISQEEKEIPKIKNSGRNR